MKRVLLPEFNNPRIKEASDLIQAQGDIVLVPFPVDEAPSQALLDHLRSRPKFQDATDGELVQVLQNPLYRAAGMVATGEADVVVAGVDNPTADVLRPALQVIGLKDGNKTMSSFFRMTKPNGEVTIYADCAVVPSPTPEQRAEIAISTAESATRLNIIPRVALLSFSTDGSAKHEDVESIQETAKILKQRGVGFIYDGEVQFDAAVNPEVMKIKNPKSPFAEQKANVLIFPDLNAGNIAYKVAQEHGSLAEGPFIQGLDGMMHDLSRGATVESIVATINTAVQLAN